MDTPSTTYLLSATAVMFAVTFALRGFAFAAFGRKDKNPPEVILYIGRVISPAVI